MSSIQETDFIKARMPTQRGFKLFDHQVAGQSLILRLDEETIGKCMIPREYQFYTNLPHILKPFVPQLKGMTQIPLKIRDCSEESDVSSETSDSWQQKEDAEEDLTEPLPLNADRIRALSKTSCTHNGNGVCYNFMLLEDLMSYFKHPCVLDLKMGVRQHGDDAPPEKVIYQENKCRTTTSHSLGLRLCGMKVFNVEKNAYISRDKMFGRQLSDDDLKLEIVNFLDNGQKLRQELVKPILSQLNSLKQVIEQLEGYRFYSCSLLIIYDGHVHSESDSCHISKCNSDSVQSDSNNEKTCQSDSHVADTDLTERENEMIQDSEVEGCEPNEQLNPQPRGQSSHSPVILRIVDFAHATFDGFEGDTVKHIGADHGFILGINTLLDVFKELS
ncbi:inositol hexakisphosphate kinase 1-like isoform X2 [Physella acuta]|nr:inositol hexakisphosphate kinase 1-like isoform X2 [Physella acuta]XP_059140236.1 inositol hexakisphosphate kinase 1-like isoform X2 [Physella acuta]XP_059140237.1 inositol hexakisphosphate kinase 1-like isoform X2 [Physella acuta]XP_059140238.1 inositol hexakisphosphate kinase 1-like isoform X2 [Physella acuta]XP_059140239.1 inositol hexakisphosphate kinase 1-like isoform X2 [Physella acuta]XP_059140240.1 inositol hexakisphosphate kinase 1-like isoform X2 [Physella acuta]